MPAGRQTRVSRDDARLVRSFRKGDEQAFEELVRRYQDPVYNVAYRMVGEREAAMDVAQEAFMKAFRGIETYNTRMAFKNWLYRIATNAAIDHLRRRAAARYVSMEVAYSRSDYREQQAPGGVEAEPPGSEDDIPENVSLKNETAAFLQEAILKLPENYRAAIVLHHLEGLGFAEVGRILGVPRNTAKTWAHRGRGLLSESLEGVI